MPSVVYLFQGSWLFGISWSLAWLSRTLHWLAWIFPACPSCLAIPRAMKPGSDSRRSGYLLHATRPCSGQRCHWPFRMTIHPASCEDLDSVGNAEGFSTKSHRLKSKRQMAAGVYKGASCETLDRNESHSDKITDLKTAPNLPTVIILGWLDIIYEALRLIQHTQFARND